MIHLRLAHKGERSSRRPSEGFRPARRRHPFSVSLPHLVSALILLYAATGFFSMPESAAQNGKGNKVTAMHIALQEGFEGDTVLILVDGKEVFRKSGVTTRLQTGFADSIDLKPPESSVTVEVSLPLKNVSASIQVQVSGAVYLGVSVTRQGSIGYQVSRKPFGYL